MIDNPISRGREEFIETTAIIESSHCSITTLAGNDLSHYCTIVGASTFRLGKECLVLRGDVEMR
jgi:hypothetical protein